jgi:hypothetical protein
MRDLLSFARQWAWLASDRVHDFDDVIRRPIRSLDVLHDVTTRYAQQRAALQPPDPESRIVELFRSMLRGLTERGEDVDRLHDWACCLSPFMQPERTRSAMRLWINSFTRFAHGKRAPATYVDESLLVQLSSSFKTDVIVPSLQLLQRCRATDARMTAFDQLLETLLLREHRLDPSAYVSSGYRDVLVRSWWRRQRATMTAAQIAGVRAEQVENVRADTRGKQPSWLLDDSIDETALLEGVPDFDRVAGPMN